MGSVKTVSNLADIHTIIETADHIGIHEIGSGSARWLKSIPTTLCPRRRSRVEEFELDIKFCSSLVPKRPPVLLATLLRIS